MLPLQSHHRGFEIPVEAGVTDALGFLLSATPPLILASLRSFNLVNAGKIASRGDSVDKMSISTE